MEWLTNMNRAIDYIEKNLCGKIDYEKTAREACCSVYHFQRMFTFMRCSIPLKRRKPDSM